MKRASRAAPETGDEAVSMIRKLQSTGDFDGFEKSDYLGLLELACRGNPIDGESIEKAFTRGLETPAGIELFGLMKPRQGSEVKVEGDAPQDTVARRDEPATAEFELKAKELARKTGLSYAQAYTRIIDDPKYRRLRDDANGERQLALIRTPGHFRCSSAHANQAIPSECSWKLN